MNRLSTDTIVPRHRARRITHILAFSGAALAATVAMAWMAWPAGTLTHTGTSPNSTSPPLSAAPLMLAAATASTSIDRPDLPEETPTLASRLTGSRILGICGITPDLLAAAGVTRAELNGVYADLINTLPDDRAAFAQSIQAQSTAKANVARLKRTVSAAGATTEVRANLAGAESVLVAANSAIDTLRSSIIARVSSGIGASKSQRLALAIANRKNWHLAPEYLVVNRTEAEWVQLRDALAERRICTAKGESASQRTTEFLARVEGDAAVQTATSALRDNKSTVTTEWQEHDTR